MSSPSHERDSKAFSFRTSTMKLHCAVQCEGSPRFSCVLQAVAGTHWSEDTLGLPPENLARCVLPPRSSKVDSRVNFPLSSYSAFREKNVSQEK